MEKMYGLPSALSEQPDESISAPADCAAASPQEPSPIPMDTQDQSPASEDAGPAQAAEPSGPPENEPSAPEEADRIPSDSCTVFPSPPYHETVVFDFEDVDTDDFEEM